LKNRYLQRSAPYAGACRHLAGAREEKAPVKNPIQFMKIPVIITRSRFGQRTVFYFIPCSRAAPFQALPPNVMVGFSIMKVTLVNIESLE
jgi:hypothetical protein